MIRFPYIVYQSEKYYPHGSYNQFEFVSWMAASGVMLVIDYKNGLKDVRRNLTPVRFRLITVQAV